MTTSTKLHNCKEAFAVPGDYASIIDLAHPVTGKGVYSGETLEEIRKRHPGAVLVSFDKWIEEKGAAQNTPITWRKIDQDAYDEALGCLPPETVREHGFLIGEPTDHHASGAPRFYAYVHKCGFYFASERPVTKAEFQKIDLSGVA